jgi:hypothetical protein
VSLQLVVEVVWLLRPLLRWWLPHRPRRQGGRGGRSCYASSFRLRRWTAHVVDVKMSRPHPFGKGRGGGGILASEGAETLFFEPTSLKRGEGLTAGWRRAVGGELGWRGQGGGGRRMREDERISTVMRLMEASNSARRQ